MYMYARHQDYTHTTKTLAHISTPSSPVSFCTFDTADLPSFFPPRPVLSFFPRLSADACPVCQKGRHRSCGQTPMKQQCGMERYAIEAKVNSTSATDFLGLRPCCTPLFTSFSRVAGLDAASSRIALAAARIALVREQQTPKERDKDRIQQQEYPGGSPESEPLSSAAVNFPRRPQAEMVQGFSTSPSVHETVAWMGSSFAQKEFGCHESSRTQTLRGRCLVDLPFLSASFRQEQN